MTPTPDEGVPGSAGGIGTGPYVYRVEARTSAPPEEVWPLLGEARRWRDWSFLTVSALEREGSPDPDGVGAVRRFSRFGVGSREEVVAWDPPHRLGYRILSGFPVRDYRADVTLEATDTGTRIEWAGSYAPKWPGTARVLQEVLPRMMQRFADDVARYADQRGH
jgi:uncharacterized protein YndB with AHSA1/START domain